MKGNFSPDEADDRIGALASAPHSTLARVATRASITVTAHHRRPPVARKRFDPGTPAVAEPTEADLLLSRALRLLAPLVRLLVARGVNYPRLSAALKPLFIDAARAELARAPARLTWTAISVLSGVHRKDMRDMLRAQSRGPATDDPVRATLGPPRKALTPSLAIQVATRWNLARRYRDTEGRPRKLPLRSDRREPSFEQLVEDVSSDVHAQAVLDELQRLNIAAVTDGRVRLVSDALVPSQRFAELTTLMAENVHDHIAAAAANLSTDRAGSERFLEHAMFADELSAESVAALNTLAKQLWKQAVMQAVQAATELVERDRERGVAGSAGEMRMRFGSYFYAEPKEPPALPQPDAPNDPATAGARRSAVRDPSDSPPSHPPRAPRKPRAAAPAPARPPGRRAKTATRK